MLSTDDDSWWLPGSLDRAAPIMDTYPKVGLVAAQVRVDADDHIDDVSAAMSASPLSPWPTGPAILRFLACAVVVRRAAYLDGGGCHRGRQRGISSRRSPAR